MLLPEVLLPEVLLPEVLLPEVLLPEVLALGVTLDEFVDTFEPLPLPLLQAASKHAIVATAMLIFVNDITISFPL